jgi:hypothetical protein
MTTDQLLALAARCGVAALLAATAARVALR